MGLSLKFNQYKLPFQTLINIGNVTVKIGRRQKKRPEIPRMYFKPLIDLFISRVKFKVFWVFFY